MALLYKSLSRKVLLTSAAMKRRITTDACQILMSPSLTSIDFPDIWTSSSCSDYSSITKSYDDQQTATVIDGRVIAEEITSGITSEVRRMKNATGNIPGLAVIMVGQRRDSQTYVRNKIAACEEAGIKSEISNLPEDCTEDQVLNALSRFHEDPSIHGILVQLPLPQHLDESKILNSVHLEKDVDGFHPLNMGNLAMRGREPLFLPCTPKGCIELLIRSGVEITGKRAVVIGRSNIVGLPTSLLLQRHHATVSIVHAFTRNPEQIAREADIVVAAAGVPNLVRGSWLKPGAIVIDVGTNPVEDPSCEFGYRLIGDVCYEEASRVASAITPVPGGVGPVTVAMLLLNTLESAKRAHNFA
ncbi:bifunctional protein FolD 1, mitochondrial isoform X3 [Cucumis melo]|nr:bifunctional protein FolD 1, mitochondrial isoform X3 [Cucumis melo]